MILEKYLKITFANVSNAYINQKNELIIRTSTLEDIDYIKEKWPTDAFRHGLKRIDTNPKFYIALYNVSTDFDVDDVDNKNYMLENYKITTIIGHSYIKISPWKFDIQPDQCYHCQKFVHFITSCPDIKKKPTCLRCANDHSHKNCRITDPNQFKCSNCGEKHSAVSKSCSHMIEEVKRNKETLDKKTKRTVSKTYRVESAAPNHSGNLTSQQIAIPVTKLIMLMIYIVKDLNIIHESIYENPQYLINIISNHFGPLFAKMFESYLRQPSSDENNESNTIESENEMFCNDD
ncbi:nascent polypeptide-associated complex subunit muscle-specific form-like [Brachionus plicatilis]|uniref:Nascent polypeptide-associated complex subunit muscle-specific form-like n=1 Tax=Brachionus plicatilis TaxID=10195 RepID=A0A3M7QXI8_BRAPC|nr:nascent polypeptide-associated complex subunit muscle-specific form-like [Brachionus plicatilis]